MKNSFGSKAFILSTLIGFNLGLFSVPAQAFTSVQALKILLQKNVKTLERPITVYHYGTRASSDQLMEDERIPLFDESNPTGLNGSIPLQSPLYTQYFKTMTHNFLIKKGPSAWTFGNGGLYAAVDPLQSESFAGTPPFLLEIKVHAQVKYLPETFSTPIEGTTHLMTLLMLHESDTLQALKELNIKFFTYEWLSPGIKLCEDFALHIPKADPRIALFFFTDEASADVELKSYFPALDANTTTPEKRESYLKLAHIFQYALDTGSHSRGFASSFVEMASHSFDLKKESLAQIERLIQSQTFRCDPQAIHSEF